jgi:hypothetical protein
VEGVQHRLVRAVDLDVQTDLIRAGHEVKVKNVQQPLSRATRSRTFSSTPSPPVSTSSSLSRSGREEPASRLANSASNSATRSGCSAVGGMQDCDTQVVIVACGRGHLRRKTCT